MKSIKKPFLILPCIIALLFSGCYEEKVMEAASKLEIGMTKVEVQNIFKDVTFLKEQTVAMYPNSNEDMMRSSIIANNYYEFRKPENLVDLLTFDGNTKVYSYLIRREKIYANPNSVSYLAVFLNTKEDKVVGWAHMSISGDVETWRDTF